MRNLIVSCDGCGKTLIEHAMLHEPDYIELTSRRLKLIFRDYHFCDLNCLDRWRDKERRISE